MRTIEADNTDASLSGGISRSSVEASVMGVERRAKAICLGMINNHNDGRINHD